MKIIKNYNEILLAISNIQTQNKNYITNFYQNQKKNELWFKNKSFFLKDQGDIVFLFRKRFNFYYLWFIAKNISSLEREIKDVITDIQNSIVIEILEKNDSSKEIISKLFDNNFMLHETLVRMQKVHQIEDKSQPQKKIVQKAVIADISTIHEMYINHLDKYSELIPLKEELQEAAEQNSLFIIKEYNQIKGIICFEKTGRTAHLKEWFVIPKYRAKGFGSELMKQYFSSTSNCVRHILWVKKSDPKAIKIYEHYGYKNEGLVDKILINKR